MRRTIAILAAAAAVTGMTLATAPSFASAPTQTRSYDTIMMQTLPLPSSGAIVGKMTLSVANDGLINGWYVPEDAGPPVEVTGSKHGSELWLEIGQMGSLRVYGSVKRTGTITGTATQYPDIGGTYEGTPPSFSFVAKPAG